MVNVKGSCSWFWLAVLALLIWAYYPGLWGGFVHDDVVNIEKNSALSPNLMTVETLLQGALSGFSGFLGRPVAMLSFAIQIGQTGLNPLPMKVANLAIHALNGIILYFLTVILLKTLIARGAVKLRPKPAAVLIAAAWLLHPLNVTAVSYIVQRMASLSTLFMALGVLLYAIERDRQQMVPDARRAVLVSVVIAALGLLSVLTKEIGALLPIYLLVVEIFVFQFQARCLRDRVALYRIHRGIVCAGVMLSLYVTFLSPYLVSGGYESRAFSITERLLTEVRVLFWYLQMIVAPDISEMTIYHDGFEVSQSLVVPPTTLLSLVGLTLLLSAGWLSRNRCPWLGFGVFWFLGGHLLESTVFPLELVYEHRNYLPGFGILFASIVGFGQAATALTPARRPLLSVGAVLMLIMLTWATRVRTYVWSDAPGAALMDAVHHPESVRANIQAGNEYSVIAKAAADQGEKDRLIELGDAHFRRASQLDPESANGIFGHLFMYYEHRMAPPAELFSELRWRLANGRIDATTMGGLQGLSECKLNGYCTFGDEYYFEVMDAAFQNSRIPNSYASTIIRLLARFYSERNNDHEKAILLTKRAIELAPNESGIALELAGYLARAGYIHLALDELDHLERKDCLGRYRQVIYRWRQDIERMIQDSAAWQGFSD